MNNEMVKAIVCGRKWTDKFTRYEYREAFLEYYKSFGRAAEKAASEAGSAKVFASELVELVQKAIESEHFFNRGAARADSCMTLVAYFCPMLEKLGLKEYSDSLCNAWNKVFPKRPVASESFETILGGFRHSIMGIDLENKH